MKQIINSILDTDLYKLTMMQAVVKKFPKAKVKYKFINRGNTKFPEGFGLELRKQLKLMENLSLTDDQRTWLSESCGYLEPTFIDLLYGYRFDSSEVGVIQRGGEVEIEIDGYWYRTMPWEATLMALISELYFIMTKQKPENENKRKTKINDKMGLFRLHNLNYADFGTRRRFSYAIQEEVVKQMKGGRTGNKLFVGTSNVDLAYKYNLTPIGTHAHEWFMFHAAKYGYKMANHLAMEHWVDVYRGDLGIALSDTLTTEVFFKSFDKKFAKLFDGVRHDSGDAFEFADKTIAHYKKLGIDPMTKVIVFSDGLNPELAVEIKKHCIGKIKSSFGIGTNFSNDVGVKPLNMVIKIIEAKPEDDEWHHTIKLSDSVGKYTGDKKEIEVAKYILNVK